MAETTLWAGASGKKYKYWIYKIGNSFKGEPGNYIFAKQTSDGSWEPVYIGETGNLSDRLANHEKMPCVQRNGGTHVHAHISPSDVDVRNQEERDLLDQWDPPCNRE